MSWGERRRRLEWYASLAERSPYELIYAPAARRRLKEIGKARGLAAKLADE